MNVLSPGPGQAAGPALPYPLAAAGGTAEAFPMLMAALSGNAPEDTAAAPLLRGAGFPSGEKSLPSSPGKLEKAGSEAPHPAKAVAKAQAAQPIVDAIASDEAAAPTPASTPIFPLTAETGAPDNVLIATDLDLSPAADAQAEGSDIEPAPPAPTTPLPAPLPTPREGRAPGLERRDDAPAASARGIEQRSDRAAERTLAAGGVAEPPALEADGPDLVDVEPPAVTTARTEQAPAQPATATNAPVALPATMPSARGPSAPLPPAPVPHLASPRFAEEVGIAIARRVGTGPGIEDVVVRVEPADMGRIHVQIRFAAEGGIEAVLSADQPRVLEQLRLGGAELHRALVDAGGRTDVAPLRFESRSDPSFTGASAGGQQSLSQNQGQNQQQQQGSTRWPHAATTFDPLPDGAAVPVRIPASGGRLDLIA